MNTPKGISTDGLIEVLELDISGPDAVMVYRNQDGHIGCSELYTHPTDGTCFFAGSARYPLNNIRRIEQ